MAVRLAFWLVLIVASMVLAVLTIGGVTMGYGKDEGNPQVSGFIECRPFGWKIVTNFDLDAEKADSIITFVWFFFMAVLSAFYTVIVFSSYRLVVKLAKHFQLMFHRRTNGNVRGIRGRA